MSGIGELPELMEELFNLVTFPESWGDNEEIPLDFPDRAKEIIREISAYAQKTVFYRDHRKQMKEWAENVKNETAAEVYFEILCKIANAPTQIHAEFVAIGLMPELYRKLGLEE